MNITMEKSMSLPLKDQLTKKLSLQLNIPKKIIDIVIADQFTSAFRATSTHNSIELSGFGKFVFNMPKAQKQMVKYNSQMNVFTRLLAEAQTEKETKMAQLNLSIVNKNIEHLKPKLTNHES